MTSSKVAEIAVEYALRDGGVDMFGRSGRDDNAPIYVRPRGVRLDNDGCLEFWINFRVEAGLIWTLTHDGVGWRAQRADGAHAEHVYRLADTSAARGTYVDVLPAMDGGQVTLDPSAVYRLQVEIDWDRGGILELHATR